MQGGRELASGSLSSANLLLVPSLFSGSLPPARSQFSVWNALDWTLRVFIILWSHGSASAFTDCASLNGSSGLFLGETLDLNDFHLSLTYIGFNDGAFILPAYLLTSPCVFGSGIRGVYSSSGSESGEQAQVRSTARRDHQPVTRSV